MAAPTCFRMCFFPRADGSRFDWAKVFFIGDALCPPRTFIGGHKWAQAHAQSLGKAFVIRQQHRGGYFRPSGVIGMPVRRTRRAEAREGAAKTTKDRMSRRS